MLALNLKILFLFLTIFISMYYIQAGKLIRMSDNFHNNFGSIWESFLSFEIKRSREALKYFGNANNYFVLQTIAWHNIYILNKKQKNEKYESLRKEWGVKNFDFEGTIPDKLSILTASQISGLDKETTRRTVKSLEANKWVVYSPSNGIVYSPTESNNQHMIEFNEIVEIPLFLKLFEKVKKFT